MEENNRKEYITEQEAGQLKELFSGLLMDYKAKDESVTDQDWLEQMFQREIPGISPEEAKEDAEQIVKGIHIFDRNLEDVNRAASEGISKERWLASRLEEAGTGLAVNEYGQRLQALDDALYAKNTELAEALQRSADGHVKMSPNLDGNIAENVVAHTTELSGFAQGKNIKVEVRDVFTPNSVDVRATNLDTGQYQNYQLKFGKDAQATIDLIERGNYDNQRIVVPKEQLEEVQQYFSDKGSQKTITDHIEAWGAKGKSFTKQEMKELQLAAQEDGLMPSMDYSHYQTKDLALSIGKNAGAMALMSVGITTGLNVASKLFKGEKVDSDELVESALRTGADSSVKVITAGTLQVGIRRGIIHFIPKATPAGVIVNMACVGIENAKILFKIASGDFSLTQGIDQMGRVSTSMICGLSGMAKGTAIGAAAAAWIPIVGIPLAVVTGLVGGMVGYFAGSKVGEIIYNTGKKVAEVGRKAGKAVWQGLKKTGRKVKNKVKQLGKRIFG